MTIAITGATGQLGRLVIDKLKAKVPAGEIVALARNPGQGRRSRRHRARSRLRQA